MGVDRRLAIALTATALSCSGLGAAASAPWAAQIELADTAEKAGAAVATDLAAARALFEANLQAIHDRDREAYLDCYRDDPRLVRSGPGGPQLGFEGLAATAGDGWPDHFEARRLELSPIRPGVVYGSYRYRVRFDDEEAAGRSERLFLKTDDGWKIAATTAFPAPAEIPPPPLALVGATLIDGRGGEPVPDSVVLVRDGLIECAGPAASCELPAGVEVIDLAARWITPGLVDAHVHFSQSGWVDGRPDFLDLRGEYPYDEVVAELRRRTAEFYRAYLCSGVTAVFDVGGYPWTWGLRASAEADRGAPHVAASGPLLSTIDFWLNLPGEAQFLHLADADSGRQAVRYLAANGSDAVKIWYVIDEPGDVEVYAPAVRAVGEEAAALGLPLIVHATGLAEAKVAVDAGASVLVHSVWDRGVDNDFLARIATRGTIYVPTLSVTAGYERLVRAAVGARAPEVDDPNGCVDAETLAKVAASARIDGEAHFPGVDPDRRFDWAAEREWIAAENLRQLIGAGVPIAMGTDAGNPLTLHGPAVYAELEAMQAAGMKPMAVLHSATAISARAMGREADLGTLEPGKRADLLVLTADPAVDIAHLRRLGSVMRGGELRPVGELAARPTATDPAATEP